MLSSIGHKFILLVMLIVQTALNCLPEPDKNASNTSKQMDIFLIKSKFILYLSLPSEKDGGLHAL